METIRDKKITLTITRPNGETEIVDVTEKFKVPYAYFANTLFSQIKKATKDAGRGDVISFDFVEEEYAPEEKDYQGNCERCGKRIDTRKAYKQQEWIRFAGKATKVAAYYCDDCHKLLANIGLGEKTALEERGTEVPAKEMINKEELV